MTEDLRRAWADWRAFADGLTLADSDRDACLALHGRLFRLCGKHPLKAKHLDAVRGQLAAASPWLEAAAPDDDLGRLARAAAAAPPVWQALFCLQADRTDYLTEMQREAEAIGVVWDQGRHWESPYGVSGRFEPVSALREQPREAAMASVVALWDLAGHPNGGALWKWLQNARWGVRRVGQALEAAVVFGRAIDGAALTSANVGALRLDVLVGRLAEACEQFTLRCLLRLGEELPGRAVAVPVAGGKPARVARTIHQREVPDPLPVEPFFRGMAGAEAFLRAVAEEPLEDAHRLAFADWLDDHGHAARADFVRLQCQLAGLPWFHPLRDGLSARADALLAAHADAWARGLDYGDKKPFGPESFQRGLLERVHLADDRAADSLDDAFAQADVRGLGVGNATTRERLAVMRSRPWLSRLTYLCPGLHRYYGAHDELRSLAEMAELRGVTHLDLSTSRLYGTDLIAVLGGLKSPALVWLSLAHGWNGRAELTALTGCGWLKGVRSLDLRHNGYAFGAAGLRSLISSDNVSGLRSLNLARCHLPGNSLEALANSPFTANLTALSLSDNHVGNVGTRALVKTPFMKNLTALDVSRGQMLAESVRVLVKSDLFRRLNVLDLGREAAGAIAALADAPESPALTALSLEGNDLGGLGPVLAEAAVLKHLSAVNLRATKLTDADVKALVESPALGRLAHFDLRENELGKAAAEAVRKRWPSALC